MSHSLAAVFPQCVGAAAVLGVGKGMKRAGHYVKRQHFIWKERLQGWHLKERKELLIDQTTTAAIIILSLCARQQQPVLDAAIFDSAKSLAAL